MQPIHLRVFEGTIDFSNRLRPWTATAPEKAGASAQPAKILIVDSDSRTRMLCRSALERCGFAVTAVPDGESALAAMRDGSFATVVVEMLMPGMDGIEILRHIRRHFPQLPVIAMNSLGETFDYLNVALKLGATDVLPKPVDPDALIRVVRRQGSPAQSAREELRQYARQGVALAGQLFIGWRDEAIPCDVVNLGVGGAVVTCDTFINRTRHVTLYVDHFGRLECRVVHITGKHLGLEFILDPAKKARLKNMLMFSGEDRVTNLRRLRRRERGASPDPIGLVRGTVETPGAG